MTYRGKVKDGVIVLDPPNGLPEGTEVEVQPLAHNGGPSILEQMEDIIGIAEGLPPDMAENHDHYIHGTPKRPK